MSDVFEVPPYAVPRYELKVEQANKRAMKAGLGAPYSLEILGHRNVPEDIGGFIVEKPVVDIQIHGKTPRVNGWQLAAVVDWDIHSGAIIRRFPDYDGPVLTAPENQECDHCQKIRTRNVTILIANSAGEVKQVGKGCLTIYTGIHVGWVSVADELVSAEERADYARGDSVMATDSVLLLSVAIVRAFGFHGKSSGNGIPTYERFLAVAFPMGFNRELQKETLDGIDSRAADSDIRDEAYAVREWAVLQSARDSEYLENLARILNADWVSARNFGMAVSAVAAYRRNREREIQRAAEMANKSPVPVGNRVLIQGRVGTLKWVDNQYGSTLKMRVIGKDGWAVWGTVPRNIAVGIDTEMVVEFYANVEASRDDETFGFYSRPTKARILWDE